MTSGAPLGTAPEAFLNGKNEFYLFRLHFNVERKHGQMIFIENLALNTVSYQFLEVCLF